MLKSLGSYAGTINGSYDDVSVRRVKHFQKKHGLLVTGSVDERTLQSIVYSYEHVKATRSRGGAGQGHGTGEDKGIEKGKGSNVGGNGKGNGND